MITPSLPLSLSLLLSTGLLIVLQHTKYMYASGALYLLFSLSGIILFYFISLK